jgi:hypothetical protein
VITLILLVVVGTACFGLGLTLGGIQCEDFYLNKYFYRNLKISFARDYHLKLIKEKAYQEGVNSCILAFEWLSSLPQDRFQEAVEVAKGGREAVQKYKPEITEWLKNHAQ